MLLKIPSESVATFSLTFAKVNQVFSPMNPYVKSTLDGDTERTESNLYPENKIASIRSPFEGFSSLKIMSEC